jgi:hypothetical protein
VINAAKRALNMIACGGQNMESGWQMSTPELHLNTALVLNGEGHIMSTREPEAR